jgi:hypothetical protein
MRDTLFTELAAPWAAFLTAVRAGTAFAVLAADPRSTWFRSRSHFLQYAGNFTASGNAVWQKATTKDPLETLYHRGTLQAPDLGVDHREIRSRKLVWTGTLHRGTIFAGEQIALSAHRWECLPTHVAHSLARDAVAVDMAADGKSESDKAGAVGSDQHRRRRRRHGDAQIGTLTTAALRASFLLLTAPPPAVAHAVRRAKISTRDAADRHGVLAIRVAVVPRVSLVPFEKMLPPAPRSAGTMCAVAGVRRWLANHGHAHDETQLTVEGV